MKKAILVATIGAMTLSVNAGDWGKAPVGKAPIIEECVDLGGEISVGYKSDYIFKGVRLAGDSAWADVNYTFDNLAVPITVGAWYLNGIHDGSGPFLGANAGFDELDLYVSAALGTFAGFDVALGYTHYVFPEFRSNVAPIGGFGELGLNQLRLGMIDEARTSLERSFAGDPYNVWIFNTLDLLDTFEEYELVQLSGFELMLHQDEAGLLDLPPSALVGPHQYENAALAVAAVRHFHLPVSEAQLSVGLRNVTWPARLTPLRGKLRQLLPAGHELWLDGSHNAHGAAALAAALAEMQKSRPAPLVMLLAMMNNRSPAEFLAAFGDRITKLYALDIPGDANGHPAAHTAAVLDASPTAEDLAAQRDLQPHLAIGGLRHVDATTQDQARQRLHPHPERAGV